jgi:hypothetical protein
LATPVHWIPALNTLQTKGVDKPKHEHGNIPL